MLAEGFPKNLHEEMERVLRRSEYVSNVIHRYPEESVQLLCRGLESPIGHLAYYRRFKDALCAATDRRQLMKILRIQRNLYSMRIAWRKLSGRADVFTTMHELSALADAAIQAAYQWLREDVHQRTPLPTDARGKKLDLLILALGKLGGSELNFSSDVDLMFCCPDSDPSSSAESVLTRMAQDLIQILDKKTEDGFVFRVDMRLRPYGDSGPLVMSESGLELYYQEQGREWERYALVKARFLTGDKSARRPIQSLLDRFVYRRYLDYSVLAALRDMKHKIQKKVAGASILDDIKRGPGGIRQIEFICQAFQLVRGGREPAFQSRSILFVLNLLEKRHVLSPDDVGTLREAYGFWRALEDVIQMLKEEQTHRVPRDPEDQARVTDALGFASWDLLEAEIHKQSDRVAECFERISAVPPALQAVDQTSAERLWVDAWDGAQGALTEPAAKWALSEADWLTLMAQVKQFREQNRIVGLSSVARARLDTLMPLLLKTVCAQKQPLKAFERMRDLLLAIVRRSAYLVLLYERPNILDTVIWLMTESRWVSERICRHPLLLDDVARIGADALPFSLNDLQKELDYRLDECQQMEDKIFCLQQFKLSCVFQIACAELKNRISPKIASDHLSALAQVILHRVMQIAHSLTQERQEFSDIRLATTDFAVVAYGKLGSCELTYESDLDLVFLYRDADKTKEGGAHEFFYRLAQNILRLLQLQTPEGQLYVIDTRLRPSGQSGLLVSEIEAFTDYQLTEAWTWEHQALVRARVIGGSSNLEHRFEKTRQQALRAEREAGVLQTEIQAMRQKMQEARFQMNDSLSIVRDGPGGLTDIEFMVQYCILRYSAKYPELLRHCGNIDYVHHLKRLQILSSRDASLMVAAYDAYCGLIHKSQLKSDAPIVLSESLKQFLVAIDQLWSRIFSH